MYKYFEKTGDKVTSWKSKEFSDERIIFTITSTDKFAAKTIYDNARIKVRFNGNLLRQNQVTYNHGPTVNIYLVYETILDTKTPNITLGNCLFGAIKLTNIPDMVLDLIQEEVFYIQVEKMVKMSLFLELI